MKKTLLVLWPTTRAWALRLRRVRERPGGIRRGRGRRVGNEQAGLAGGHVEDVDAVRRGVDHLLVVGRVGVDVEVEAAGVWLVAETPDAMAGVLVDPCFGRRLL